MYVYKLASHDKCQYAFLNKEQKGITDSRRASSLTRTCRDAPPYTHARLRTRTQQASLSPFLLLPAGFSSPCVFIMQCREEKLLTGRSVILPSVSVNQPCSCWCTERKDREPLLQSVHGQRSDRVNRAFSR